MSPVGPDLAALPENCTLCHHVIHHIGPGNVLVTPTSAAVESTNYLPTPLSILLQPLRLLQLLTPLLIQLLLLLLPLLYRFVLLLHNPPDKPTHHAPAST